MSQSGGNEVRGILVTAGVESRYAEGGRSPYICRRCHGHPIIS